MHSTLLALDIDGTLIDTRASFGRIVREVGGIDDDDIDRFRRTGAFNDDWELARAARAWVDAGKPNDVDTLQGWQDAVSRYQHDPGDLSAVCIDLYRGGYWRDEQVIVDATVWPLWLGLADVVACTGRDAWEFAQAQQLLGHRFARATTMEHAKKPDPQALLRLVEPHHQVVVLVGDTAADQKTIVHLRPLLPPAAKAWFVDVNPEGVRTARGFAALVADAQQAGVANPIAHAAQAWSSLPS
jgi:phosphoglycolate phosphatase-like HAD superfamily hydrolase